MFLLTMEKRSLTDRQLRGHSIPLLGTNNQVYCDILRQTPSAKSDFCRVRLDAFGRDGGPKTLQKKR